MEKPPAYSEYPVHSPSGSSTLSQHLNEVRTARINNTITSHILPQFEAAAADGLSKISLILIPSEDTPKECYDDVKSASSSPEVTGFPAADNVFAIRLQGEENGLSFWRQPTVVRDLEGSLKSRLHTSGHRIWDSTSQTPPPSSPVRSPSPEAKKSSPFFRRKQTGSTSSPEAQVPNSNPIQPTWSTPTASNIRIGEVKINVFLKDISTRVVTDMGLYESQSEKAVVVKMEIGG